MKAKAWLEFLRIHTVALTGSILVLGYVIAGGNLFSLKSLMWFLFGLAFHALGFSHNNLMDIRFDIYDAHKQHFPLVRGDIDYFTASEFNRYGLCILAMLGAIMTRLKPIALLLLFVCMTAGFTYNWICKKSLWAPVPITICFGLLIGVPFFTYRDTASPLILAALGYGCAQIWAQIAVLGYAKDIGSDRVNLLRELGLELVGNKLVYRSKRPMLFALMSKAPWMAAFLVAVLLFAENPPWVGVVVGGLWAGACLSLAQTILPGPWKRGGVLRYCALCEIFTYFAFVVALYGVLGTIGVLVMVSLPLAWYLIWVRVYWGTWRVGPKV